MEEESIDEKQRNKTMSIPEDAPVLTILSFATPSKANSKVSISRTLQNQAVKWAIQEPKFDFVDSQFKLHWQVSDWIEDRLTSFRIYDGFDCKEGSNDITDSISDYYNGNVYLQNLGLQPDGSTPHNPSSTGEGFRDFRLFIDLLPTVGESPIFYYTDDENQYRAQIDFCIRFSLYNDDPDSANAIEVNFQETLISFTADLTDGFEVTEITVEPNDRTERTANIECEIIAYECDEANQPLVNPGYLR